MGRNVSTPQEIEARKNIANNLNRLLNKSGFKKIDIIKETKIPKTSLYNYFSGDALPSEQNVEKLASFFHVDKSEIDPRYSDSTAPNNSHPDIDDTLYYNGKEIPEKYKKIIKDLMDMDD